MEIEIIFGNDIYVAIYNLINFILPIVLLYYISIDILNKEKTYYINLILISVFYLIILFRFTILETVDWDLDFVFWSIFEAYIFLNFIYEVKKNV